jgi:KaiC/GvpD/RAD55 family RecA-like ATPase
MEFMRFGIDELDTLLGGGLVNGKAYLLECTAGTKPRFLVSAFLRQGYLDGKISRIDTLEYTISEMIENLESTGFSAQKAASEGKLLIVDYVNDRTLGNELAGPYFSRGTDMSIHGVAALSATAWDKLRNTKSSASGLRFALQSATALIRNFGFEETLKFIDSQIVIIKKWPGVFIITVNPETLTPVNLAVLEEVFEGIIELKMLEEKNEFLRYVRVKNSPIPSFRSERLTYEIAHDGLSVSIASKIIKDHKED